MKTTQVQSPSASVRSQQAVKKQIEKVPRYHVVLLDDDDHTYDYVIGMLRKAFGYTVEKAFQLAEEVDTTGRVIVLTTTLEHAELKRDQIRTFGRDWRIPHCAGGMSVTLERAD